jgi:uncharacterized protein YggE
MNAVAAALLAAGCLAGAALPALAQTAPPAGISVQGRGTVRRPADFARFAIVIGDRQNPAGGLDSADTLVAALKKAGIDDATVVAPLNNVITAQAFVTVVGTVRKPTPAGIRTLVTSLEAALPPGTVAVQTVNYTLGLDDCSDAETIATQAALDDARLRAQRVASAAHVELGPVLAANVLSAPNGPCPTKPDRGAYQAQQFDLFGGAGALDVFVVAALTVTFAIR